MPETAVLRLQRGQEYKIIVETIEAGWRQGIEFWPRSNHTAKRTEWVDIGMSISFIAAEEDYFFKNIWQKNPSDHEMSPPIGDIQVTQPSQGVFRLNCDDSFGDRDYDDVVFLVKPVIKEFIFVAGYDEGGTNFSLFAKARINELKAGRQIQTGDKITTFNFATGEKIEGVEGQSPNKTNLGKGTISILHVYRHIIEGGRSNQTIIKEFSIFSHAFAGGPVLVNTFDTTGDPNGPRDPNDRDGRVKDFNSHNMPGSDLQNFRNAFSADTIIWVWGCRANQAARNLIRNHGNASSTAARNRIETDIRGMINTNNYAKALAIASQRSVFAALPGIGVDFSSNQFGEIMQIDQGDYATDLGFYRNVLGIQTINGYGVYIP